jgi:hypothetical protein
LLYKGKIKYYFQKGLIVTIQGGYLAVIMVSPIGRKWAGNAARIKNTSLTKRQKKVPA